MEMTIDSQKARVLNVPIELWPSNSLTIQGAAIADSSVRFYLGSVQKKHGKSLRNVY
jgi:hypothetical protein